MKISKKKADEYDHVLDRCVQLENTNKELLRQLVKLGGSNIPPQVGINTSTLSLDYGAASEDQGVVGAVTGENYSVAVHKAD